MVQCIQSKNCCKAGMMLRIGPELEPIIEEKTLRQVSGNTSSVHELLSLVSIQFVALWPNEGE